MLRPFVLDYGLSGKCVGDEEDGAGDEDKVAAGSSGAGGDYGVLDVDVSLALYAEGGGSGLQVSHGQPARHRGLREAPVKRLAETCKLGMQVRQYLTVVLVVDTAVDDMQGAERHRGQLAKHGVNTWGVVGCLTDGEGGLTYRLPSAVEVRVVNNVGDAFFHNVTVQRKW